MSNRTIRVNELVQRELSDILHKHYQTEAVAITITEVRVSPDLHDGKVFISILGSADGAEQKMRWLKSKASAIRQELGRRIVLKFLPKFEWVLDESVERGLRLTKLIDDLGPLPPAEPEKKPEAEPEKK